MPEVRLRVRLDRRQGDRDGMVVLPEKTAREFYLSRDLAADQAARTQDARPLNVADMFGRWPRRGWLRALVGP
jgi:hypothetical protein